MDIITVGEVLKPHGVKGELKVKPLTDDASRFKKLKTVYINNKPYRIESCRTDNFAYLKLEGVSSADDALKLVGEILSIDRINAVHLPDDTYFIVDLIGCVVKSRGGETFGIITEVNSYGAADVITAKDLKDKIFRFPNLLRVVEKIDTENKTMFVKAKEFLEVCVYED